MLNERAKQKNALKIATLKLEREKQEVRGGNTGAFEVWQLLFRAEISCCAKSAAASFEDCLMLFPDDEKDHMHHRGRKIARASIFVTFFTLLF
jgi:hypothetical protein